MSLQTGEPVCNTNRHSDFIFELAFSRDGEQILTAGRDSQALLWEWKDNRRTCPPLDHSDEVYDVALTPDRQCAVAACRDGYVRVWELTTAKLIARPYKVRGRAATSASVVPDGSRAVIGVTGTGLVSIDLANRTSRDERSINEVLRSSEVICVQQVVSGNLMRLTTGEWLGRWRGK